MLLTLLLVQAWEVFDELDRWQQKGFKEGTYVKTTTTAKGKKDVKRTKTISGFDGLDMLFEIQEEGAAARKDREKGQLRVRRREAPVELERGKTEDLEVGGRKYTCLIGAAGDEVQWVCDEVQFNDGILKSKTDKLERRVISFEETVEVGGKKYACPVMEQTADGKTERIWFCSDVPGGWLRRDVTTKDGTTSTVVTAFEIKK